ncbi:hypothetical protein [Hymenobacter volaticus]|uniref:Uncharacterized protein n=1 Tax=Hymenobacter volaticus TaxID=2932254 RepID=A0ABY4GGN8_9BACT|nr:hypothetical protein [Hymenobacter volaticus]UOQ69619.1 hypothetical protein MUN86_29385 [Hymenobacter volaticus]
MGPKPAKTIFGKNTLPQTPICEGAWRRAQGGEAGIKATTAEVQET